MKTISLSEVQQQPALYSETAKILEAGRLVCFPTPSGYKLGADLGSPAAVTAMLQAKRRVKNAPALVFVPDVSWVDSVVANISDKAAALMKTLWPGQVTLLFLANEDLPSKVRKPLTKAKGWLGIRIPSDEVSTGVLRAFGKPILVSSANLASKHGAHSVAQVRKNFGRTIDLLIDAGDLNSNGPRSTLVDLTRDVPEIVRPGAVSEDEIKRALAG
jgi:L-threonylcarbamoyladenylate synthase